MSANKENDRLVKYLMEYLPNEIDKVRIIYANLRRYQIQKKYAKKAVLESKTKLVQLRNKMQPIYDVNKCV